MRMRWPPGNYRGTSSSAALRAFSSFEQRDLEVVGQNDSASELGLLSGV